MRQFSIIWISFLLCQSSTAKKKEFSPSLSIIYGPGLNTDVVLPVRYFYIQAVGTNGKKYAI